MSRYFHVVGAGALAAGVLAGCGSTSTATTPQAPPAATAGQSGRSGGSPSAAAAPSAGSPASTVPVAPAGSPVAPESNPPGDIPDTVAYVPFALPGRGVSFTHPEGWAQTASAGGVRFADKLNSVTVSVSPGPVPTVEQVRRDVVPTLGSAAQAPEVRTVESAVLPAGPAVRVTWRVNSEPDPVTGKVFRDEVVTLLVGHTGTVVRMDLAGAVGSDNVDPYRVMSDSLKLA